MNKNMKSIFILVSIWYWPNMNKKDKQIQKHTFFNRGMFSVQKQKSACGRLRLGEAKWLWTHILAIWCFNMICIIYYLLVVIYYLLSIGFGLFPIYWLFPLRPYFIFIAARYGPGAVGDRSGSWRRGGLRSAWPKLARPPASAAMQKAI